MERFRKRMSVFKKKRIFCFYSKTNPNHLSLHFKKVNKYWSVRVGKAYRALGIEVKNGILWFWIGTHDEYDRLISK